MESERSDPTGSILACEFKTLMYGTLKHLEFMLSEENESESIREKDYSDLGGGSPVPEGEIKPLLHFRVAWTTKETRGTNILQKISSAYCDRADSGN